MNKTHTRFERKKKVRGVSQRNEGLKWLLRNNITDGVFYFGDDDNTFHRRLFDEIRTIKKIGMVPTGSMKKFGASSPLVRNGKIVGFADPFPGNRKWPVDMASLAFNIAFWRERGAPLIRLRPPYYGRIETSFMESMNVTYADLEPKAKNCTEILVWHTKAVSVRMDPKYLKSSKFNNSNVDVLRKQIIFETGKVPT